MPSARLIGAAVSIDSSERAWDSWAPVRTERVDRLLLATGLRAQTEALENLPWDWAEAVDSYVVYDGMHSKELAKYRARLAALEGA